MTRFLVLLLLLTSLPNRLIAQSQCTGILVDEEGQPIAHAVVGTRRARSWSLVSGSIEEGDPLWFEADGQLAVHPGEARTDALGSFQFNTSKSALYELYALLPNGQQESLEGSLSGLSEAGPWELGEITLSRKTVFSFGFLEEGKRLEGTRLVTPPGKVHFGSFSLWYEGLEHIDFTFELETEPEWRESGWITPDGVLRLALSQERAARLGEVHRVRIDVPGRASLFDTTSGTWNQIQERTYVLPDPKWISLRVEVSDERNAGASTWGRFPLYSDVSPGIQKGGRSLTGLGGLIELPAKEGVYDVDLPVLSDQSFWLGTCTYEGSPQPKFVGSAGPFAAGEDRRIVKVSLRDPGARELWGPCVRARPATRVMQVWESDGSRVAIGKLVAGADLRGELRDGVGLLAGKGTPGSDLIFRTGDEFHECQVLPQRRLVQSSAGWKLALDPWREVELHLVGLSALEQAHVSPPTLLQVRGEQGVGRIRGTRLCGGENGIVRFRYRVNAGAWRAVGTCYLLSELAENLHVQPVDGVQVFTARIGGQELQDENP